MTAISEPHRAMPVGLVTWPKGVGPLAGESVLMDICPSPFVWSYLRYIVTFGLTGRWRVRHRLIVTDQRVVLSKGIVSKKLSVVSRSRLQDVNVRNRLWAAYLVFSTAGGTSGSFRYGPVRTRDARAVVELLSSSL